MDWPHILCAHRAIGLSDLHTYPHSNAPLADVTAHGLVEELVFQTIQLALQRGLMPLGTHHSPAAQNTLEYDHWREAVMVLPTSVDTLPLETDADGVVRVSQTRVTLDTIVQAFAEGATAEEIAQQYPPVSLADIYSVIGYYLRRRAEVDAYLQERRQLAQQIRAHNEALHDPAGIRERLLSRRSTGTA